MYGPIVLASPTGTENMDGLYADDSRGGHIAHGKQISMQEIPMLVGSAASLPQSLQKINDDLVAFTYTGSVYPAQKEALKLIPFFRLHDSRYAVYFHQVTEAEVESIRKEVALSERKAMELANQTVDLISPVNNSLNRIMAFYMNRQKPESIKTVTSDVPKVGSVITSK